MTVRDQLIVSQEACYRALPRGHEVSKGAIDVTVMDDSLLCTMGKSREMITSGTGNYYADIKVFDGDAWLDYLIAGNSPRDAVIKAVNYAFDCHATDWVIRERIVRFRTFVTSYLSQKAGVIKQEGMSPRYRVVFECDLDLIK